MRFAIAFAASAIAAVSAIPAIELESRQTCDLTTCVTSLTTVVTGLASSGTTSALPLTCITSLLTADPTTIVTDCAAALLASGSTLPAACTACVPAGTLPAGL